jgi:hypothetical protein
MMFSSCYFDDATFSDMTDFTSSTFAGCTNFIGTTFSSLTNFVGATFSGLTSFRSANFLAQVSFEKATFSNLADFQEVVFSGLAHFLAATFEVGVFFDRAVFLSEAFFFGATFNTVSRFDDVEMKSRTTFEMATFKKIPPEFFGAKLHQGTVWRAITWPPPPNTEDFGDPGSFIDAYACLKLEMDRLKKHEDELDFFALELQSRRVLRGAVRGMPIALYGVLSDYGRSYLRPLVALFVAAAIGALAFWYFGARGYGEAVGLSVANMFNVFGFRKDFDLHIDNLPAELKVFSAFQTILGTTLVFLFGLGIRNRFRIK